MANAPENFAGILVTDFDGTLTRHDFYSLIRERLVPAGTPDYHAEWRAGRMDHFDFLNAYFGAIHAGWDEISRVLRDTRIDPHLSDALDAFDDAGWRVIVASAGCAWYIDTLLGDSRDRLEVHANPGRFDPATGLVMRRPKQSPFYCPNVGIDKPAIVRAALATGAPRVAFAGDGLPDLAAAELVDPDLRFARGDLAEALRQRHQPFIPFHAWAEIPRRLIGFEPARVVRSA